MSRSTFVLSSIKNFSSMLFHFSLKRSYKPVWSKLKRSSNVVKLHGCHSKRTTPLLSKQHSGKRCFPFVKSPKYTQGSRKCPGLPFWKASNFFRADFGHYNSHCSLETDLVFKNENLLSVQHVKVKTAFSVEWVVHVFANGFSGEKIFGAFEKRASGLSVDHWQI